MTTISALPPQIAERFNAILLSMPIPKFRQDEADLWNIYKYLFKKCEKKLRNCPGKKRDVEKLQEEFLRIYEQITQKKENSDSKEADETQVVFYRFRCSTRSNEELLERCKYKTIPNA